MTKSLPTTAVVRVAHGSFDPSRFAEVDALNKKDSEYLAPAIRQLPGLIHWYAGVSPEGSIVNVSVWDSGEHAEQLDRLTEMAVDARWEMKALGVSFTPRVHYPVNWVIWRDTATREHDAGHSARPDVAVGRVPAGTPGYVVPVSCFGTR